MWLGVITLLPEMFAAVNQEGVFARALSAKHLSLQCFNPRDFTEDKHRTVDDRPYGGGPGMVMMVEPPEKSTGCRQSRGAQGHPSHTDEPSGATL